MIPVAHKNLLNYTRKLYHNTLKVTIENKGKGRTKKIAIHTNLKNNHKQNYRYESINLSINDKLIMYLSKVGEPSINVKRDNVYSNGSELISTFSFILLLSFR